MHTWNLLFSLMKWACYKLANYELIIIIASILNWTHLLRGD